MNPRKVPGVPPRPLFAIVVALRNWLHRLWRRLAPAQVVMFESMFQGLQTVHIARAACQLGLPEHLVNGPRSVEDLALASGTKPEFLARSFGHSRATRSWLNTEIRRTHLHPSDERCCPVRLGRCAELC